MLFASLFLLIGTVGAENVFFNGGSSTALPGEKKASELEGQNYQQYHWTSPVFTAPEGFTTLRLTFLGNSNGERPAGYPIVTLSEFYLYDKDGNAVELTAGIFSSNATETTEGKIEALCDGVKSGDINKYDWYWHSSWSSNVGALHYLEVNVSELEADLTSFSFGYVTRREQASPAEILVTTGQSTEDVAAQYAAFDPFSAYDFANKSFYIRNVSVEEELYLSIETPNLTDQNEGGVKILEKVLGNTSQVFNFIAQEDGSYYIKSASGYFLNTLGDWGANAVSEPVTDESRSNFNLNYIGNGTFSIQGLKGLIGPNNDYKNDHPYEIFSNHSGGKIAWVLEEYIAPQEDELKAVLQKEIGTATSIYEGFTVKTYEEVVALKAAIDKAQEICDKAGATADEVAAETAALTAAVALAQEYPLFSSLVKTIEDGKYLIYYTEGDTKYYLQTSGANSIVTVTENPQKYDISVGTTNGGKYAKAYFLKMNDLYISNTSHNATNIETKDAGQLWSSQVVFEMDGKCAIRLTNATASDGWHGDYFIGKGETAGTTVAMAPTVALDAFIWTFEKVTMTDLEIAAEELGKYLSDFYTAYYDVWGVGWRNAPGVNNYSQPADDQPLNEAYEEVKAFYEAITEETSIDDVTAKKAYLESLEERVTINQPESGKYYRLRCAGSGMKYLQATLSEDSDRLVMDGNTDVDATFCYVDGALLSYTTGLYINAYRFNEVGVKSDVVFSEASNGKKGAYNILVDGRYIFGAQDNNKLDSGAGTPDARDGYTWWLEEVTTLPVAVSAAGYATLYAPVALSIPEGVTVYVATVKDGYVELNEVEGTIPAETGVILEAEAATYDFTVAADVDAIESDLVGSFAKSEKNAEKKVYTLQAPAEKEVGFYLFKGQNGEGATTYINGFRSWVEVDLDATAPMFSLGRGEGTTGIEQIVNAENVVIYDLAGRRVEKMEKGIYIVNGKKVIK